MAVVMITEVPGAGTDLADAMKAAGLFEKMQAAKGFRSHHSGTTSTGYRVVEVWDSRDDWQAWFDGEVKPSLPPGVEPTDPTFVDIYLDVHPG